LSWQTTNASSGSRQELAAVSAAWRKASGLTLIELVLTITLLSLLALAVLPVLTNTIRADSVYAEKTAAKENLRYALERLVLELTSIDYDATNGFAVDVVGNALAASDSSVTFSRTTVDPSAGENLAASQRSEKVSVALAGSELRLVYTTPSSGQALAGVLTTGLVSFDPTVTPAFLLTWRDSLGNRLDPATAINQTAITQFKKNIRRVDILLSIRIEVDGGAPIFETIARSVDLAARI
jgi:type II secretory pathway pseudopilin PulG